jgi:hypothetical protein
MTTIVSRSTAPAAVMCVSIDCERDKGPAWRVRRPATFEGVRVGVIDRLDPLFRHFGAKPTYLLSPEVVRDPPCVRGMAALPGSCELGTHLHAEYVDPAGDDDLEAVMFQAALPPPIERAKLTTLTRLFGDAFGRRPRSFRAGRFGIGGASLGILADLGYRVDSSVTPFVDWTRAGPGAPCFREAPPTAYRPDPEDPSRPGTSPLWEVPVTVRPSAWERIPIAGRLLPPRWLRPSWGSGRALVGLARRVLAEPAPQVPRVPGAPEARATPKILNVMFHNIEVVPGASPYSRTETEAQAILSRLAVLLAFARDAGIPFVGLDDLPEVLA